MKILTRKIEKPLDTEALAGEVSRGIGDTDKLSARLSRYSTAKKRALENLYVLRVLPCDDLTSVRYAKGAAALAGCGNYLAFRNYYTVDQTRLHSASFCKKHLICPLCAIRRGSKTLEAYLARYAVIKPLNPFWRLSMITLTVKNGHDLASRFDHLQKSVKRVFDRRRDWLKKGWGRTEWRLVHGWVGTYEVTHNPATGWHPHAHIMVLHTSSFDYAALKAEWLEVTGDSHVLNVSAAHHPDEPAKDFVEVFKYAVKFADMPPEANIHAWDVLRGKRLLFSGGAFWGVDVPDSLTDAPLDDLPYIELFYTYSAGGYSLQVTS